MLKPEVKMNRKQLSVKTNLIFNSVGTTVYLFCQWMMTILVVKFSGYEDAGRLSLAMSIGNTFYAFALYGVRSFQVSDLASHFQDGIYIAARVITCIAAFLAGCLFTMVNSYNMAQILVIILFLGIKISEAFSDVYHGIDQKAWRMDVVGVSFFMRGIASLLAYTVVIWQTKDLSLSLAAACIASFVIILLYDLPKTKHISNYRLEFNWKKISSLLKTCLPLVIYSFILAAIPLVPRYFLQLYNGDDILGIYASVATPAVVVQVLATFIFSPLITLFAEHYKNNDRKAFVTVFLKCLTAILAISAAAILAALFLGEWGLAFLFGPTIVQYSYLLVPVIICTILIAIAWFIGTVLTVVRDFKGLIIGNVTGLIVCVALSPFLIRNFSMDGVNYVLIVSLSVEILLLLLRGRYVVRKNLA